MTKKKRRKKKEGLMDEERKDERGSHTVEKKMPRGKDSDRGRRRDRERMGAERERTCGWD